MDSIVLGVLFAIGMNAAACNDHNIRIFTNIKIIVYQIIHIALGYTCWNVYFFLGVWLDNNIDTWLPNLWNNVYIFG